MPRCSRGDVTGGNLEPMPFVRKFGAAAVAAATAAAAATSEPSSTEPSAATSSKDCQDRARSPPKGPLEESNSNAELNANAGLSKLESAQKVIPVLARPEFVDKLNNNGGTDGASSSADGGEISGEAEKKVRKSRWSTKKSFIPGMPTILPSNWTDDQRKAYLREYFCHFSIVDFPFLECVS
ncbi:unnamed protein product [Gongylonema pulchrum]|uniref:PIPK domain-containing protein n=1 Tax=Gongylonema pulchrum TaxID=637853 RepID=A0A183E8A7_9BILA|nr:unnamed protein product [Gongylonema pulchrum]